MIASKFPLVPLAAVCDFSAGGTPTSTECMFWTENPSEGIPWVSITDMSSNDLVSSTKKKLSPLGLQTSRLVPGKPGTVLFAMYASVGTVSTLAIDAVWNQAILGLSPVNESLLDKRFLHFAMKSLVPQLPMYYRSNTQDNLNAEQIKGFRIPLPPINAQRAIADYLDRETNEIDAMLDKLEGLAQLLANRRRNKINSAFTAPKLAPLWNFCDINPPTTDFKSLAENTLVTFMPLETIWSDHRVDFSRTIKWSQKVGSYTEFQKEDVLIPKITPTFEAGRAMVANIPLPIGLATTEVHIARAKTKKALPEWLTYAFQTTSFLKEGEATLQGVGNLRRITPQWLQQFKVPEFSLTEQAQVVAHLNKATAQIDAMLAKVQELKDLLIERRSALITAAVTGQIEVN